MEGKKQQKGHLQYFAQQREIKKSYGFENFTGQPFYALAQDVNVVADT